MGGCFGGRQLVGRPRDRWDGVVGTDAVDLLPIQNWKAAASKREG
jgi:hypothetical protein